MTAVIVAAIVAFIVVAIVMAVTTSSRKKKAIASLEEERKAVGRYSILDLIDAEVSDLELRSIDGADGLSPDVLLKVWSSTPEVHDCDRSDLRYELSPGIAPGDADIDDVTLVCNGSRAAEEAPSPEVQDEPDSADDGRPESAW